jgi:hypothetical protein
MVHRFQRNHVPRSQPLSNHVPTPQPAPQPALTAQPAQALPQAGPAPPQLTADWWSDGSGRGSAQAPPSTPGTRSGPPPRPPPDGPAGREWETCRILSSFNYNPLRPSPYRGASRPPWYGYPPLCETRVRIYCGDFLLKSRKFLLEIY